MNTQAGSKEQQESCDNPIDMQPIVYSLKIGFFAGIIWGLVRWLSTGLNFTKVNQAFLLDPFVKREVLGGILWQAAGLAAFIVMSIVAALIYFLVLGRFKGPWPGLLMGIAWWGLVYAFAGPIIGAVPPLQQIGWNSIVTDFCLFMMWGLFIGYSIAFEFHNESDREPQKKKADGSPETSS
ncbi:YqhR family membrane protein [Cohnella sp.]|uniref:YqhR family membrane protein n=1 Tax=Cohnella sp. TaxID=1883426 RepID=UPI00356709AA